MSTANNSYVKRFGVNKELYAARVQQIVIVLYCTSNIFKWQEANRSQTKSKSSDTKFVMLKLPTAYLIQDSTIPTRIHALIHNCNPGTVKQSLCINYASSGTGRQGRVANMIYSCSFRIIVETFHFKCTMNIPVGRANLDLETQARRAIAALRITEFEPGTVCICQSLLDGPLLCRSFC